MKPKHDESLSNLAFNFNLRPYNERTKMAEELQEKKRKMQEELKAQKDRAVEAGQVFEVRP